MAKVASKQKRIDEIAKLLEKGMERKDILQKLTKIYNVSDATIDKEIKEAKEVLFKRNEHKEKVRLEQTTQTIKDAVNEALLSDMELEAILCTIATGNLQVETIISGEAILRNVTPFEQISAIDKIYKKRGSNATTKTDITTNGEKIVNNNTNLDNDKLDTLNKLLAQTNETNTNSSK